jgi:acyl-CoA synthetase (AMP-forming)/AMP-acid ligase II
MIVTEFLARNARLIPGAIALVEITPSQGLRREISWKEFDDQANRVANALIARGIKKGEIVMLMMMNSLEWLPLYFGILRTGAIAAPLNFRFLSRQIQYCVDIAEPKLIILDQYFLERVEEIRPHCQSLGHCLFVGGRDSPAPMGMESLESSLLASAVTVSPSLSLPSLNGEDSAGVYFTSGTTGSPKATLLCHRNLEHCALNETFAHQQSRQDTFLLIQPLYHCGGKMHWLGSLMAGGRAVLTPGEELITPGLILQAIQAEQVTICFLFARWLEEIVSALESGSLSLRDYDLSSLRLVHSGAQPIPPVLVRSFLQHFPHVQYDENYGLTETCGPCMHLGLENRHKLGSFGYPRLNVDARVVDKEGQDVPVGTVGECIIRGPNVMQCYYKNPEETRAILRNGWLHTGDLVKQDEEGFISYVDRKKDMIISEGEDIFPVDIESVIIGQHKVEDVAVIGVPDERYGEVVIAVVQLIDGATLTKEELRAYYEPQLPKYSWPRLIIFDEVPRNPTGKIEKPNLRERYKDVRLNSKDN